MCYLIELEFDTVGEIGKTFVEIVDGELGSRFDKGIVHANVVVALTGAEMQRNTYVCAGSSFGNFSEEALAVVGFDGPGGENTLSSILIQVRFSLAGLIKQ